MSVIDNELLKHIKSDVVTPDYISKQMAEYLTNSGTLLEPSVGTGNLLKYVKLQNYTQIDVFDIKNEYLEKIEKIETKDENKNESVTINKYNKDFIKYEFENGYDNIILNPPYIRIQELSEDYRKYIKNNYTICNTGNFDLYYIFILKCLSLLSPCGVMVCIVPNSYIYNKSSTKLRKYFIENKLISEIIDFKSEKVFKGVSTYCCITVFTKCHKQTFKYNNKVINYSNINNKSNLYYSLFCDSNESNDIKSESNFIKLKDFCTIKNGIATLRDKIFIHDTKLFEEDCWKEIINGRGKIKYIIYPYYENESETTESNKKSNIKIIPEPKFKLLYPKTYEYLFENKCELQKRDKGKKQYSEWYAYGRTQGLKGINGPNEITNEKNLLYLPIFIDPNNFKVYENKLMLHYGSISITNNSNMISNETIIKSIYNSIYYIIENSSKRGGEWINISTRILNEINVKCK
jgi:tRNA1(Val) A37 N6-methylase TrmN6